MDEEVGDSLWDMRGSWLLLNAVEDQKISKHALYCTSLWGLKDKKRHILCPLNRPD